MDHSHKSNNAPLPYHKNTTSEQKCTTERRYFYIYIYRHKMYPTCPACVNISVVIYIDKNCVTITATKLKPVQKRMLWCAVKYEDIRGLKKVEFYTNDCVGNFFERGLFEYQTLSTCFSMVFIKIAPFPRDCFYDIICIKTPLIHSAYQRKTPLSGCLQWVRNADGLYFHSTLYNITDCISVNMHFGYRSHLVILLWNK